MLICNNGELVAGAGNSENSDSFLLRCCYYAVTRAARGVRSARLGQKYSKSIFENVVLEFPVSLEGFCQNQTQPNKLELDPICRVIKGV
jgi:hypothetical protein